MISVSTSLFILVVIQLADSFNDTDFKCEVETKRIGFVKSSVKNGKRHFKFLCQDLLLKDKIQKPECYLSKPLKCDDSNEGCKENEWINGFQVLDVSAPVGIIVPLCCKSPSIKLGPCDSTQVVNPNGGMFVRRENQNKILVLGGCKLETTGSNNTITDMKIKMSSCIYKVEGEIPKFGDGKPIANRKS